MIGAVVLSIQAGGRNSSLRRWSPGKLETRNRFLRKRVCDDGRGRNRESRWPENSQEPAVSTSETTSPVHLDAVLVVTKSLYHDARTVPFCRVCTLLVLDEHSLADQQGTKGMAALS